MVSVPAFPVPMPPCSEPQNTRAKDRHRGAHTRADAPPRLREADDDIREENCVDDQIARDDDDVICAVDVREDAGGPFLCVREACEHDALGQFWTPHSGRKSMGQKRPPEM
eukprot:1746473-Rhodomonas_salina.1